MKKVLFVLICSLCFSLNVFAATHYIDDGNSDDTNGLKTKYNSFSKTTVSSPNTTVTLYGKSECDGSTCSITYSASKNSSFKDALARAVTCSNGETSITYQSLTSGNVEFKADNKGQLDGTVYWDEDYSVSCSSDGSGDYSVSLDEESGSSSSSTGSSSSSSSIGSSISSSSTESSDSTASSGSSSSGSSYSSSSTVSNEQTGVNTYFIILSVAAVVSYVFMMCVKKFNLFKNI